MFDFVTDIVRVAHLGAFAVGLGAAAFLEITILKRFRTCIDGDGLRLLHQGHQLIASAVRALWMTGLTLLILRIGVEGAPLSPKILMKLIVVSALTANMALIERWVLPELAARRSYALSDIPVNRLAALGAVGGFSGACWLSALALGGVGIFKTMGLAPLLVIFLPTLIGGAAVGGTIAVAIGHSRLRFA